MLKVALITLLVLSLIGCQNIGIYVANLPNDFDTQQLHTDIAYGDKPWQRLDVYTPKQPSVHAPVIMFLYGGGWSAGNKKSYKFVADTLTREGFVVVIPDYIKYPDAIYPAYQEDAAKATAWVVSNIERYGGNSKNLFLMGHSAGAHMGAMLLANKQFLAAEGLTPDVYRGFVGLAGPYNFTPKDEKYKKIFGGGPDFEHMKVMNFVDGSAPPMLLQHGSIDTTVSDKNMETLADSIKQKGGEVKTVNYPMIGHFSIIGAFSRAVPLGGQVIRDTLTFMRANIPQDL